MGFVMEILYDPRSCSKSARPVEKLRKFGAGALSDGELLSIVLGTKKIPNIDIDDIKNDSSLLQLGFTESQAARFSVAKELFIRYWEVNRPETKILSTADAVAFMQKRMCDLENEEIRLVYLNAKGAVIGEERISSGTDDCALFNVRQIFREVVRNGARSFVMYHNHPLGDPKPSAEDITATNSVSAAGNILGTKLVDHIIIGKSGRYYSFTEDGKIK